MASNVVRVMVVGDTKSFQSAMGQAGTATEKAGTKITQMGSLVRGALVGTASVAVGAFLKTSIDAFSELEQATGATESVFGEFAKNIENAAGQAADAVGLSADQYMSLAANLGGMLQNLGFTVEESATKTQELITLGADLAATYGGTAADAVSALSSLLRGERDPIEKYAISVKDADVKARSAALGLDRTTTAAAKNADAIAALDIVTEQAAKTEGQFADEADTVNGRLQRQQAEMKNAQAAIGQQMVPAMNLWNDILLKVAEGLNNGIRLFKEWSGQMTESESIISRWESETGKIVTTAEDAMNIWVQWGDIVEGQGQTFGHFITTAELTNEELQRLIDNADHFKLSAEDLALAQQALDQQMKRGNTTTGEATDAQEDLTGATDDLTGATDDAAAATKTHADRLRDRRDAIDETMGLIGDLTSATDDVAEAQTAVNDALAEFGVDSPEYRDAVLGLADANIAQKRAVQDASKVTEAEYRHMLTTVSGLTKEQADVVIAEMLRVDGFKFKDKTVGIKWNLNAVSGSGRPPGMPSYVQWPPRAAGGPVVKGRPYLVGEKGPEAFIPDQSGTIIPNSAMSSPAAAAGGAPGAAGATVNITIHAGLGTDPNALGKAVFEALQRYQRINGPLPLDVRLN